MPTAGIAEDLHAFDVVGHRVVEGTGDRLQTRELHLDAVDCGLVLDDAEVVGQRGVVVTGHSDRRDRVLT